MHLNSSDSLNLTQNQVIVLKTMRECPIFNGIVTDRYRVGGWQRKNVDIFKHA